MAPVREPIDRPAARSPLHALADGIGRARFGVTPRPQPTLPEVDGVLAGAVEVDITPPPGMPKAGYSSHAHHCPFASCCT